MNVEQLSFNSFMIVYARCFGAFLLLPMLLATGNRTLNFIISLVAAIVLYKADFAAYDANLLMLPFEVLIGFIIGFPVALLVSAGTMFGELFESGRGQTLAGFYDPNTSLPVQPAGKLMGSLVWVIILGLGGLELIIKGLSASFISVPISSFEMTNLTVLGQGILSTTGYVFVGVLTLFIPVAGLFLLTDLAIGFLSKLVPQLILFSESFQIKSCIGLIFFLCLWQLGIVDGISSTLISLSGQISL